MSQHLEVLTRVGHLLAGERDLVARMATAACELYHGIEHYHWVGFYRLLDNELVIGPYQGGHGCLRIALDRGICGRCARERRTVLVDDVQADPDHIACAASTRSEIVVPVLQGDRLLAVLDLDSDLPAAFSAQDQWMVEQIAALIPAA